MAIGGRYRNQGDLVTEVLAELGVLAPGQNVDVEDQSYVTSSLDSIYRMLAGLEVCFVADPNNIPGEWFRPLAVIIAGELATKFGLPTDDFQRLKVAGLGLPPPAGNGVGSGAAAMALKAMSRGKPSYEYARTQYF